MSTSAKYISEQGTKCVCLHVKPQGQIHLEIEFLPSSVQTQIKQAITKLVLLD